MRLIYTSDWRQTIVALREARAARRLSIAELGERVGVGPNRVGVWERGEEQPSVASLNAWASELGFHLLLVSRDPDATGPRDGSD